MKILRRLVSYPLPALTIVILALVVALSAYAVTGTVTQTADGFAETGVTVGDGNWIQLREGTYSCFIWYDSYSDGNVDVEWLVAGTTAVPTKVANVDVSSLVTVVGDAYGIIGAGADTFYRIEVEGSDTVNWRCDRYAR